MPRNGTGTFQLTAGEPVLTGTTISSSVFNALTADLANALTTSVATDGQTAMTGNLPMGNHKITGLATGVASTDAATVAQVTSAVPAGVMMDFGGSAAPTGYLLCDGSAVSRATYSALFAAISTTWGAGDGSTTFNVPDLRRRTTIGAGGTAISGPVNTLGAVGGEETHVLTTPELAAHAHNAGAITITDPQHTHVAQSHTHTINGGAVSRVLTPNIAGGGNFGAGPASTADFTGTDGATVTLNAAATGITASGAATGTAGSGTAHNNMQPSAVVNKIIKT